MQVNEPFILIINDIISRKTDCHVVFIMNSSLLIANTSIDQTIRLPVVIEFYLLFLVILQQFYFSNYIFAIYIFIAYSNVIVNCK